MMILPRSTQRPDAAVHVADPDDVGMQRAEERDAARVPHTPQMLKAVHIDSSDPAARVLRGVLLIWSVAGVEQPVANSSSLLPKINNDFKVQSGPTALTPTVRLRCRRTAACPSLRTSAAGRSSGRSSRQDSAETQCPHRSRSETLRPERRLVSRSNRNAPTER